MENLEPQTTQWLTLLLAAAALQGLWLSGLLFIKNRQSQGAGLLGFVLFLFTLYLLNYLLFLTGLIRSAPHLLGVFHPFYFLVGPGYYFFVRRSLSPGFEFRKAHAWHLLPALLIAAKEIPFFAASTAYKLEVIEWYLSPDATFTWTHLLLGNDFIYHILAYIAAAWWLAGQHDRNCRDARWLRQFSAGFLVLLLLDLSLKFTFFALGWPGYTVEYLLAGLLALGIQVAGYRTLNIAVQLPGSKASGPPVATDGKYRTSPLTPRQIDDSRDELLLLMKNEKPYLDPSLKIADLADRLGLPSHHLSQVLSEGMDTGFYDFVNAYRIEAAKRRLKDDRYRHYSILAIGLECGFANKTTFNRTFKRKTGMTPSAYAKEEDVPG